MAAQKGREILVKRYDGASFVTVGGGRQKSFTLNDTRPDITDADSANRWRELLAAAGVKSMGVSLSGVFKDSASENGVLTDWINSVNTNYQMVIPGLGTFQGAFAVNIQYQGSHDGEAQYAMSFESAGEITFT
jgi:TP901-1 family phage major tail protein